MFINFKLKFSFGWIEDASKDKCNALSELIAFIDINNEIYENHNE